MQNLAFVGLGAMGAPMARCLLSAGFDLGVFDVREESSRPLVEMGARGAATPGEAAENADALFLMVVNAGQAEAALFGEGGAAGALAPGGAVVVMGTVGPEGCPPAGSCPPRAPSTSSSRTWAWCGRRPGSAASPPRSPTWRTNSTRRAPRSASAARTTPASCASSRRGWDRPGRRRVRLRDRTPARERVEEGAVAAVDHEVAAVGEAGQDLLRLVDRKRGIERRLDRCYASAGVLDRHQELLLQARPRRRPPGVRSRGTPARVEEQGEQRDRGQKEGSNGAKVSKERGEKVRSDRTRGEADHQQEERVPHEASTGGCGLPAGVVFSSLPEIHVVHRASSVAIPAGKPDCAGSSILQAGDYRRVTTYGVFP